MEPETLSHPPAHWVGFTVFVVAMLVLDLAVFHRRAEAVSARSALRSSLVWIGLGLLVGVVVGLRHGWTPFFEYLTAYVVEKSLSIDNLFIFLLLFSAFQVPPEHRHRVLFFGIFGALVMRAIFVLTGLALLLRFHWLMYVFGAVLVVATVRLLRPTAAQHPQNSLMLRLFRAVVPTTSTLHGDRFVVRDGNGRRLATPLFAVLVSIEATDLAFAMDSIPAVFGVTTDPFIVLISNAMAVLGLRALFFALAAWLESFRYLKPALAAILGFIAVKMLLHDVVHVPAAISLGIIAAILAVAVALSARRAPPGHESVA